MILIDSIYIHTSGGQILLNQLIEKIINSSLNNVFFLFDSRLKLKVTNSIDHKNKKFLISNEYTRLNFYFKNKSKIKTVFCLANVPPPINLNGPVHIYFHNHLLLDTSNADLNFKQKSLLWLKRRYIQFVNRETYKWHVQTQLIQKKLNKHIHVPAKNINVTPFFPELKTKTTPQKRISSASFIYVAAFSPHKNHNNLIKGCIQAAQRINTTINLSLTLDNENTKKLISNYKIPNNLMINALGTLPIEKLIEKYVEHQFLIYPSLKESFGLPLIEAAQLGLKVIAADLPYTYEVIKPSLTFDPLSVSSIRDIIINALNLKGVKCTELRIENKIEDLIENVS